MSTRVGLRGRWVLVGCAVLLALAAGCTAGNDDDTVPPDAQRLTVTFGDALTFDPPVLTVQAGRPVVLTVRNTGGTDHDLAITGMPARDVKNKVEGGHGHPPGNVIVGHPKTNSEVTIRFTPTATGTYEFYCSVTGHREAGMKGTIIVT
jgi:uncharacterized cupredoxin-like copper-binding protein